MAVGGDGDTDKNKCVNKCKKDNKVIKKDGACGDKCPEFEAVIGDHDEKCGNPCLKDNKVIKTDGTCEAEKCKGELVPSSLVNKSLSLHLWSLH